jgi:acyl carrier protein
MRPTETDALIARITAALRDIFYIPETRFFPGLRLADLGLDSLDLVEARLELEATFGPILHSAGLNAATTIGELAACFAGRPSRAKLSMAA